MVSNIEIYKLLEDRKYISISLWTAVHVVAKRARERAKPITVDGSTRSGEARKRACEDNYYI